MVRITNYRRDFSEDEFQFDDWADDIVEDYETDQSPFRVKSSQSHRAIAERSRWEIGSEFKSRT